MSIKLEVWGDYALFTRPEMKVEVDENPELARQFRVMSIPTLAVFKDGEMVKREVGAKSKAEILEMLG